MAYKLLLTEADSPLGGAISHKLETHSHALLVPKEGEVDWRDPKSVAEYIEAAQPDLIINTLGWIDDLNSAEPKLLVQGAKNLAVVCRAQGIRLLHLSSYLVFGGENKTAYDETDRPSPLGEMGRAYLKAEQAIEQAVEHFIILRLSWLIGLEGRNLLTRLLQELLTSDVVSVSTQRRGAPTFLSDAARVIVAIINQVLCDAENWGVMHYCSGDTCSEAEFAHQIASSLMRLQQPCAELREFTEGEGVTVASTVLSGHRCRDNFGVQVRTWRQSLTPIVKLALQQSFDKTA